MATKKEVHRYGIKPDDVCIYCGTAFCVKNNITLAHIFAQFSTLIVVVILIRAVFLRKRNHLGLEQGKLMAAVNLRK